MVIPFHGFNVLDRLSSVRGQSLFLIVRDPKLCFVQIALSLLSFWQSQNVSSCVECWHSVPLILILQLRLLKLLMGYYFALFKPLFVNYSIDMTSSIHLILILYLFGVKNIRISMLPVNILNHLFLVQRRKGIVILGHIYFSRTVWMRNRKGHYVLVPLGSLLQKLGFYTLPFGIMHI